LARLDQGPTASFKDFAARFMARAMAYFKPADQQVTILVATSGDTGSAIGEAFKGLEGFRVYILYPENEVSAIQKKQLDSIGQNVQAIAVDGKFDDCQAMVKQAFSDPDPDLQPLHLTSANSINLGRILPQIVYYFYCYVNCVDSMEPAVISVPSGNFGHSLGCEIARRMGLPVDRIIIATNANDEFPAFLESAKYHKIQPSRMCLSNAMNVGNPSNLARYFELYGGTIDKEGTVHKHPDLDQMRQHLYSVAISDGQTVATMKKYYRGNGIL
jgi:threonine synthase